MDVDGVDLTEFSGAINVFEIWRNKKQELRSQFAAILD
jgi:hypothetical protein